MQFHIKKLSERTVALMIGTGQVLAYFPSVVEAMVAANGWYQVNHSQQQAEVIFGNGVTASSEAVDGLHNFCF